MEKYFIVEIFPKSGFSIQSLKGRLEFRFQSRNCYLITEDTPIDLRKTTSSRGENIKANYRPLNLYIQGKEGETIFETIEEICDILSLAANNHINHFSPRLNEYEYISSWSYGEFDEEGFVNESLKHWDSETGFLDVYILTRIINKVEISEIKNRIFASAHLNRLAKYKAFSHITEAITDCVCSLEALYMIEDSSGYQSNLDRKFIPAKIKRKAGALDYFLRNYFPGDSQELNFIQKLKPYEIRSAYLHRGNQIEPPANINNLLNTIEGSNKFQNYNNFYKVVFSTIINFILNYT